MNPSHPDNPGSWKKYRSGMCDDCTALCCTMPVEAKLADLIRLEWITADTALEPSKKIAKQLIKAGLIHSYREKTGIFILKRLANGDCLFLDADRRCRVYEKRPETCRNFPQVSSRPGHCPCVKK